MLHAPEEAQIKVENISGPVLLLIIVYMALSAVNTGVSGFWPLFWTAYIEMLFVNFGDLIGLAAVYVPACQLWRCGYWLADLTGAFR